MTRDGVAAGVFTLALALVAYLSHNNLLYLLVSLLSGLWVTAGVVGALNLRGLTIRRQLPAEVFARRPAHGTLWVQTTSVLGGAMDLVLEERSGARLSTRCDEVIAGTVQQVPATWSVRRRGAVQLEALRVRSSFPFRWFEPWVELPLCDEMCVYPEPGTPLLPARDQSDGPDGVTRDPEELLDIRRYRPGDALRDVHWPTSARAGEPMVLVRRGRGEAPVWIDVPDVSGDALEQALMAATATVMDATLLGRPIGLRVRGRVWKPRRGHAWRRALLQVLALTQEAP